VSHGDMEQSAVSGPARAGGEFFADPKHPTQRRYEALRAYLHDGLTAAQVAERFGYTLATVRTLVRDFRAGRTEFFIDPRPGPKTAPAKEAARDRIVELRRDRELSIDEIATVLEREGLRLNRTGISEILAAEGLPRLWRRPATERGVPAVVRDRLPRAGVLDFDELPDRFDTRFAGLLLAIPDLVALDLPGLVKQAGYPGTREIPAVSYAASLVATKLIALRRIGHVDDIAADPGAGLFAGLSSIPKTTALRTYSYRLDHDRQQRFLAALSKTMVGHGLVAGADFDLDFHAIQHWGQEPALERHYVPKRSQRTRGLGPAKPSRLSQVSHFGSAPAAGRVWGFMPPGSNGPRIWCRRAVVRRAGRGRSAGRWRAAGRGRGRGCRRWRPRARRR